MKKIYLAIAFLFSANMLMAQMVKSPVSWSSSSKKVADKTYEITLTANIEDGWHMYSQTTPDGGPLPTKISYSKNPLVTVTGKTAKEIGDMEQKHEPLFGVDVKQFSDQVVFKQTVKLKANVNTALDVAVQYMVCDDHQCLPPTTKKFTIAFK